MALCEPKGLTVCFDFAWLAPTKRLDPPLPKMLAGGGGGPRDALDDAVAAMDAGWFDVVGWSAGLVDSGSVAVGLPKFGALGAPGEASCCRSVAGDAEFLGVCAGLR